MRQRRHPLKGNLDGLLLGLGSLDCTCNILCCLALAVLVAVVVFQVTGKVSCVPDIAQLLLANLTVDVLSLFLSFSKNWPSLAGNPKKRQTVLFEPGNGNNSSSQSSITEIDAITPDGHIPRKWRRVFTSCRRFLIYSFTAAS